MPTCEQCNGTGYNVSEVSGSRSRKGSKQTRYKCFACNGQGFYGDGPTGQQVDPVEASKMDGMVGCAAAAVVFVVACLAYIVYYFRY
jgi:hypothetical protein